MKRIITIVLMVASLYSTIAAKQNPNVIIIYADDMGYGDLACQNPKAKTRTPHLDQLAREGMRFTDAHSSSGICSPSRYALLTGQYHWRSQHDIVPSFGRPFFRSGDVTIADVLRQYGYKTAAIGKWHLGFDWDFISKNPSGELWKNGKLKHFYVPDDIDFSLPLKGGANDRGFDYYYGDGTINFPPYAWMENRAFVELPLDTMMPGEPCLKVKEGSWEFRSGPKVKGWNPYEVLPTLADKAEAYILDQKKGEPFFLYFALPSPHAPIIPNDEYDGKTKAGPYGDFMFQTDEIIGRVLKALKENGLENNTLVIFSADNGPEHYAYQRARDYDHNSVSIFRGLKRDVWEGGHHIPMIVKWPRKISAGAVSDEVISQIDIMATLMSLLRIEKVNGVAPDSYDMSKVWLGQVYQSPVRDYTVHNTFKGRWGLRVGKWLYINAPTGQHTGMPKFYKELRGFSDFDTDVLLFDMEKDPEQKNNLSAEQGELVLRMQQKLDQVLKDDYMSNNR